MNYQQFLSEFDERLEKYFEAHKEFLHCKPGCSSCCEKGDYPLSKTELEYLMQGFIALDDELKIKIQNNVKNMVKGEACPFLIDRKCSVYPFRPIVCRVHGIAYICRDNVVKVPYCTNDGKNYSKVYKDGEITINPVLENLDTPNVLKDLDFGGIKDLYDWIKQS